MKRIPYSIYKKYYSEFSACNYDSKTKTIEVDIPDERRKPFPKTWTKNGNHYTTPGGCDVYFWGTGVAENFLVRRYVTCYEQHQKTIVPGVNARERVLVTVAEFECI